VGHGFRYGIEHESALQRADGTFADFTNTGFEELQAIVDALPLDPSDYPQLRVGDQQIKVKRWYVEGFERFGADGTLLRCDPKGLEVRTVIHDSIAGAVTALEGDLELLAARAAERGFRLVTVSHNPVQASYRVEPPLNDWERAHRLGTPEDRTAALCMTTYGPDLNLSRYGLGASELIDIGAKLTYYSPYIVPFSFSSPFFKGQRWAGLSRRTYARTGMRPAVLVFVGDRADLVQSDPSLTQLARVDAEVGRIEFKAFDACADLGLYGELLCLLKGMVLDERLPGRRRTPDAELHQASALRGFADPAIRAGAREVLRAAEAALQDAGAEAGDRRRIQALWRRLEGGTCLAQELIERYEAGERVAGLRKDPGLRLPEPSSGERTYLGSRERGTTSPDS